MECTNKLKQLGIALHNFHDSHNQIPGAQATVSLCDAVIIGGNWGGTFTGSTYYRQWSGWVPHFLPFIEQAALYDLTIRDYKAGLGPNDRGATRAPSQPIPELWCPSDPEGRAEKDDYNHCNYRACRGDNSIHSGLDGESPRGTFQLEEIRISGSLATGDLKIKTNKMDFSSILDGTSNTIAFGEVKCFAQGSGSQVYTSKGGLAFVDGMNGTTSPSKCIACIDTSNVGFNKPITIGRSHFQPGRNAFMGAMMTVMITMIPPNGPFCIGTEVYTCGDGCRGMPTPSSYHSGGVNCCMVDGSVKFVSDTVETGDQSLNAAGETAKGESRWGVWGAMGTINGGESKSL